MIQVYRAVKAIAADKTSSVLVLILSLLIFAVMFYIPILSIPGNTIKFQIELYGYKDYLFLIILAVISALVITIHYRIFTRTAAKKSISGSVFGGLGLVSALTSSLFATATCGMCVLSLFSFLGAGAVFSLVDNRSYIVLATLALLVLSLYFSAKRFNNNCLVCE